MNLPQHVFDPSALIMTEASNMDPVVLYLPQPEGVPFDVRRIGKARSSWALYSRLHRMKKRHAPPAAKSLPTDSCSKRTRRAKTTTRTPRAEVGQSRWDSQPSVVEVNDKPTSSSTTNTSSNRKRGNGGPTLPKRQKSIEQSSSSSADHQIKSSRKERINHASTKQALRSFRRSFQADSTNSGVSTTKKVVSVRVSALNYHGKRCA